MSVKASLAWELLRGRPEPVFRRIVLSSAFCEDTGLDLRKDYLGLPRGALIAAAQAAARGQTVKLQDRAGNPNQVALKDGIITISRRTTDGTETISMPVGLQFLSPDPKARRDALLDTVEQFGATGPKSDIWLPLLEKRSLQAKELDAIFVEMRNSLNQRREWITEKIDKQTALISDLTPTEPEYFFNLCGSEPPRNLPPEDWIAGPLSEHRRRLVNTDLVSGLAAVLPGSLRHDMGPATLVADLDDETVWSAVEALPEFIDPFSLLGLLDIALTRTARHRGFRDLADALVKALLSEPFRRPDGMDISRLYPALVLNCIISLRRTEGLGAAPPCWQRLCAFTHAGHLLEILGHLSFDVDAMVENLSVNMTDYDAIGELLNCRSSPMWTAHSLDVDHIRAEVLGRLDLLCDREVAAGRAFPMKEEVDAAIKETGIAILVPGPLEGHLRPSIQRPARVCPEEVEQQTMAELLTDPNAACARLFSLSDYCALGTALLERATSVTQSMSLEGKASGDTLGPLMLLALTAAKQSNSNLADAVAKRCVIEARKLTVANNGNENCSLLFRILLAASAAQTSWSIWLADELVSMTLAMPAGPWHRNLNNLVLLMKQLLPPEDWQFGRATAYAQLGNAPL